MYRIQANKSGTRWIEISEENLNAIRTYSLFQGLIDSNGIITEQVLEKLRLNIRSLLTSAGTDKHLIDLCIDVIFHRDMKSFGLEKLLALYNRWESENPVEGSVSDQE